ncbi:O-antigen ligase family protein [Halomarina rubra]|uniref:O-antigen ligase family protein n=1 Tax=Halomarina rubra TaxID=2071873 RepID=A0ABD6AWJ3_9EURY|nr:O-antigen ligase family protein [Halomarina rubra]
MSFSGVISRLRIDTEPPDSRSFIVSGGVLTLLLFVLSPVLTTAFRTFLPPLPEKEYVAIAICGLVYGGYILYSEDLLAGFVASLLILITVRIAIPAGPSRDIIAGIGPQIWIFYAPLACIVLYYFSRGTVPTVSLAHYLFAGFVGWSLLAAVVGNGPRPDMAYYFTLYVFQIGLIFLISTWLVADGIVELRHATLLIVVAVLAHSIVGLLQFVNGGPLGFPHHGEAARTASEYLTLGPLGSFPIGPHINGFAFGGPIAVLITLAVPVGVAYAFREQGKKRLLWTLAVLMMVFVQRTTAWDAGRGGIVVALVCFAALGLWTFRKEIRNPFSNSSGNLLVTLLGGVLAIVFLLLPGTSSGTAALPNLSERGETGSTETPSPSTPSTDVSPEGTRLAETPSDVGTQPTGTQTTATPSSTEAQPVESGGNPSPTGSFDIPFFDTSNLGIRLQMYVESLGLTVEHPVFGIGGANFPSAAVQTSLDRSYWLHNMFLQVLVGTGIPGFLLYCASLGLSIFSGLRVLVLSRSDTLVVIGVLSGLVGAIAQLNLNPLFNKPTAILPFWALCGMLVGEHYRLTH